MWPCADVGLYQTAKVPLFWATQEVLLRRGREVVWHWLGRHSMQGKTRASREEFSSAVRLQVAGEDGIAQHYASNLSNEGLFVQTAVQAAIGAQVLLDFVLPDGSTLSRCAAQVVRTADASGPQGAGLGLIFINLDDIAKEAITRFKADIAERVASTQRVGPAHRSEKIHLQTQPSGPSGPIVGIDLGTCNCSVAICEDGGPRVLTTAGGYEALPAVLYLSEKGDVIIGHAARERMILEPSRAVFGSKRFLGRAFASQEVRTLGHFFPYALVAGPQGQTAAKVGGRVFPLEEVAAHFLLLLKQMASHHYGHEVQRAVITVPAYFGPEQREAVRKAGGLAGLFVERILNEPTAAAVAFGFGRGTNQTVLVYDLGGGTFDVSIVRIEDDRMTVLGSDGNPFLGGSDFDDRVTEYILGAFERSHQVDLRDQPVAVQRVRFAAEMAKRQLSAAQEAHVNLPFICAKEGQPLDLDLSIGRDTIDAITGDLVSKTLDIVQRVLNEAALSCAALDQILLVGGQSRSPLVHRMLFDRFGKAPCKQVHADEAVALGAALIANAIDSKVPVQLCERLPASVRVELGDGGTEVLLPRGAALPTQRTFTVPRFADRNTKISLYRGEHERAQENSLLGRIALPPTTAATSTVVLRVCGDGILSSAAGGEVGEPVQELQVLLL